MLDSNISTYIDKDGNVQEVGSGGTVDASTLNGVITGTNGITTALNTAGDKVEVKLDDNIKLGSTQIPIEGRTASLEIVTFPTGGRPYYIRLNNNGIQFQSGNTDLLSLTASAIQLIDIGNGGISKEFLHQGNVKTIGGQSIYGSGNINTTPTLKTINSQSITGDGNIYLNEFRVTNSNELNFKASASVDDLYVGIATISETGATQTNYTIGCYKFMKGTGSTSAFADLYCAKLYTSSDERLKENIKPYEPTTSVLDLSIKEFNYKDSKVKSVGVIAQEVQKLFPDVVNEDKKSGYLSVDDRSLMYMLMAEVKKLRDRVNELEGK